MNLLESTLPSSGIVLPRDLLDMSRCARRERTLREKNNSISAALAALVKSGPNTIRDFRHLQRVPSRSTAWSRLTIIGNHTATINDPTPSSDPDL